MKALVVGGTGPTGPYIVEGLLQRGYEVTIMHAGFHEIEFSQPVEHLHGDPYFKETLEQTLGQRTYDVIIFAYGRLRLGLDAAKGRTRRFIGLGGATAAWARPKDPKWGRLGRHTNVTEDNAVIETDINANRFGYLVGSSEEAVLEAHRQGHYVATYIAYPLVYGPRQPGHQDWCIIRRILDGRKHLVIADGGMKLESHIFAENAAHAVLLAVDKPEISGGKKYVVADEKLYTLRQRIEAIASYMKHELELVDMPYDLATPCHVFWRHDRGHRVVDSHKIQYELGYRDVVSADRALELTVDWLVKNRPAPGGEVEIQLGDPFDYAVEDEVIRCWKEEQATFRKVPYPFLPPAHPYRHPTRPMEPWKRPEGWSGLPTE